MTTASRQDKDGLQDINEEQGGARAQLMRCIRGDRDGDDRKLRFVSPGKSPESKVEIVEQ